MPNCCVTGCHNRYYPGSTVRFYRVPSGNRQFQVQRRRLWMEAIQQANGGSSEIRADARICGVHFVSGEASTDPDKPNFVPTLFGCSKLRQGPTKSAKWTSSACRRSQRQKANVETKATTARGDDKENEDTAAVRDDDETEDMTTVRDDEETEDMTTVRDDEETENMTTVSDDEETEDMTTVRNDDETEDMTTVRDDEETENMTTARDDEETENMTTARDDEETEDMTNLTENEDITTPRDDEETEKSPTQPASESSMDHQPSALIETTDEFLPEMQTLPVSKEEETQDEKIHDKDPEVTECEAEPETMETENKSSPSPSPQKPPGKKTDKMNPFVLLKPLLLPQGAYHVDLSASTAVSSKEQREDTSQGGLTESSANRDQPSFPCNLCDRTFTTSHYLKRHKLLHVRDVRKCLRCGALFCRRHNHVLFQTRAEPLPESEESSSSSEDESLDAEQEKASKVTEKADNPLSVQTERPPDTPALSNSPLLKTSNLTDVGKPLLVSVKPAAVPSPPSPITRFPSNPGTVFQIKPLLSDISPALKRPNLPQQPQLPPSLKIFSTQHLTSALLNVQRNYRYILSKPKNDMVKVKEEPEEPVQICPDEEPVKQVKLEKIAYDLEMVI
ncbi:uncharacterized protein LOC129370123 [Poeciliopsis prolifica]|uniref:uncharacterized protein LOC129370123 n=1 Tax=Poeciliopsis prolifica TaxID=188132 RepID=UPI00241333F2|nr:uncharacterized protein LOC129370123 [Poeciliopsis prolifica]